MTRLLKVVVSLGFVALAGCVVVPVRGDFHRQAVVVVQIPPAANRPAS